MRLTEEMVYARKKTNSYEYIKEINFTGQSINDISILKELFNLEVINLSYNELESLEDFESCEKLREVYLSNNLISKFSEIQHLEKLDKLSLIYLRGNPISRKMDYRVALISILKNLQNIDGIEVTVAEKTAASSWQIDFEEEEAEAEVEVDTGVEVESEVQIDNEVSQAEVEDPKTEPDLDPESTKINCPVCFDNYAEIENSTEEERHMLVLSCGHILCNLCYDKISEEPKNCPKCRTEVILVIQLFL